MPLPVLLLAYAAGLGCAPFLFTAPWTPALPAVAGGLWLLLRRQPTARWLLLVFLFSFGLVRYDLQLAPPAGPDHIAAWTGRDGLSVTGTIIAGASRSGDRSSLDIAADRLGDHGRSWPVRGRLRLYLDAPAGTLDAGTRVALRTHLRRPQNFGIPGEFDQSRHLARQGIFATGYLPGPASLAVFAAIEPSADLWIGRVRGAAGRTIDRVVAAGDAPLVRALLIGDGGGIPPDQRSLLSRGGISHLFAISGMHFTMVAGVLYLLAGALYRRSSRLLLWSPPRRVLPLALLPALYGYLLLTGGALATYRAFLVAAGMALYLALARRTPPARLLLAAVWLILLVDPLALFEPSLQLSVAGVGGILALLPRCQPRLAGWSRPWRWLANGALTTVAATVATTPLVLWHFHLLAPAGLLANVFAVPLIGGLALPLGLAGLALAPLAPIPAELCLKGCGHLLDLTLQGVDRLLAVPGLQGFFWYPAPTVLIGLALLVLALLSGAQPRPRSFLPAFLAGLGLILCLLPAQPRQGLTITALSVGQGEAILVSLPDGRHLLVDGGGSRNPWFDVGERLVAPALGSLGVRQLAAVILTHDHPDHAQGLRRVLESFPVGELWLGPDAPPAAAELAAAAAARRIPVRHFSGGWQAPIPELSESLQLFAPPASFADANDRSLVLHLAHGSDGALLTGDLQSGGLATLLAAQPPGPVTLLKLPHHGSWHSAPGLLFDRFQPAQVFLSAGRDNPYRLPDRRTVAVVARLGLPLWRTDTDGTLRFSSDGHGWRAEHWEQGLFR